MLKEFACCGIGIIGLILVCLGVTALFMLLFGYKKFKADGKNKLSIKGGGLSFNVETNSVYFVIIVGVALIIIPFVLNKMDLVGENATLRDKKNATPVVSRMKYQNYKVLKEEVWIDLQTRKDISLIDYWKGNVSWTQRRVRMVLDEVAQGVKEVSFCYATSVNWIDLAEKPEGILWQQLIDETQEVVNPFISLLRGQSFFQELLSRKGRMKTFLLTAPVTVRTGQPISYKLLYCNAFQGKDFEWARKIFTADTKTMTMHIIFPRDKPFKTFTTYREEPTAIECNQIENPDIRTSSDNRLIKWTIQQAKRGEKYFIKWTW